MKVILFILIGITISNYSVGQGNINYNSTDLPDGIPDNLRNISALVPFREEIMKAMSLSASSDSVNVYFGLGKSKTENYYYLVIVHCQRRSGTTSKFKIHKSIFPVINEGNLNERRSINFHPNSSDEIAFDLNFDPKTNKVKYQWLDKDGLPSPGLSVNFQLLKEGNPQPNLEFKLINGKEVKVNNLKGKVIVLNWWATSCGPCIQEMPGLNQIVKDYSNNKDVLFFAIAHDNKEDVIKFIKKKEFNYQQGLFNEKIIEAFGKSYPVSIIIDKQGTIVFYSTGFKSSEAKQVQEELKFKESINNALKS